MTTAIRAEVRKLLTTRMWWLLAIVLVAYLAFIAVVLGFSMTVEGVGTEGAPTGVELATYVYSLMSPVGYVFPLVIGSLLFTGEFRHQTITDSLLVEPRRTVFMVAKLVVAAVVGLVYGVVGAIATVGGGAPVLIWRGDGAFLGDSAAWSVIGWSVVVFGLWCVLGAVFGGVVTNQVAAIIILLAFTQFVEPIARLALSAWDATERVAQFLPGAAADAIVGQSFYALGASGGLLGRGTGAFVMLGYVVLFALIARFVTLRRDIG